VKDRYLAVGANCWNKPAKSWNVRYE